MRLYSHWVYIAKCIVGVYCDWVYNASSGSTGIVGIYSDWVYNAKCIVGTTHMLKTNPVVLWGTYCVIHCGSFRKPRQQRHLRRSAKHCSPFLHCSRLDSRRSPLWTMVWIIAWSLITDYDQGNSTTALCQDFAWTILSNNCKEASLSGNHQCYILLKNNFRPLEKEAKSLTEIINTLSEELRYNGTTEEVRKADCLCADKLKSKNTISCSCDQIKPQPLVVQYQHSSVKTITDTIREELESMKQTTYKNLFPAISSSGVKSRNSMASPILIQSTLKSGLLITVSIPFQPRIGLISFPTTQNHDKTNQSGHLI